jgi:hypothetical protein
MCYEGLGQQVEKWEKFAVVNVQDMFECNNFYTRLFIMYSFFNNSLSHMVLGIIFVFVIYSLLTGNQLILINLRCRWCFFRRTCTDAQYIFFTVVLLTGLIVSRFMCKSVSVYISCMKIYGHRNLKLNFYGSDGQKRMICLLSPHYQQMQLYMYSRKFATFKSFKGTVGPDWIAPKMLPLDLDFLKRVKF